MANWIEERCEAIRLALRIPGFPAERDIYRLIDWLGGNVVLRHAATPRARCRFDERVSTITLPQRLVGAPMELATCHETGHVLLTKGMGSLLRQMSDTRSTERLARRWDLEDEARARRFVLAWYLPSPMCAVLRWDPEQIGWESGCSREMVMERLRQLRRKVVRLTETPAWSAARDFHMVARPSKSTPALFVARRGSVAPVYNLPVVSLRAIEDSALQVSADLMALNAGEFDTKYELFRADEAQPLDISLRALKTWARSA
jgi:predicted transcriptional regulator